MKRERLLSPLMFNMDFPDGSDGKINIYIYMPAKQCRRLGFNPWVGKIPRRREWWSTPVFLPGESHGQTSLVAWSHKPQRIGYGELLGRWPHGGSGRVMCLRRAWKPHVHPPHMPWPYISFTWLIPKLYPYIKLVIVSTVLSWDLHVAKYKLTLIIVTSHLPL